MFQEAWTPCRKLQALFPVLQVTKTESWFILHKFKINSDCPIPNIWTPKPQRHLATPDPRIQYPVWTLKAGSCFWYLCIDHNRTPHLTTASSKRIELNDGKSHKIHLPNTFRLYLLNIQTKHSWIFVNYSQILIFVSFYRKKLDILVYQNLYISQNMFI